MNDNGHRRQHFEFGDFRLYPHERLLVKGDERVAITPRVLDLLLVLVSHDGELLAREELLTSIWADSYVEEGNLSRAVSTLRRHLGTQVNGSDFIETVPKQGYRFIAPVSEVLDTPAKKEVVQSRGSGWKRPVFVGAAILLVAFLALGSYFWKADGAVPHRIDGVVRLTDDPANDWVPRWTRNGQIRFFRSGPEDKLARSMLMNGDGTGQTEVRDFKDLYHALWSPDESKVLFAKPDDNTARYLANADGSGEVALPLIGNTVWSSDGKKLVYQMRVGPEKNSELFVYTLESGKSENVTNHPGFDADPSISPDGATIAFVSTRDDNAEIYTMNSDGSNIRRLTNHRAFENHPVFSPDGTSIAFNSDRESENSDVYVMNLDGSNIRPVTDWKFSETVEPGCWSPDGTRIAFFSDREGNDDIYVTSAEVFRPHLILSDEKSDLLFPSYSPDGKQIVFQAAMPDRTGELRVYGLESRQSSVLLATENAELDATFSPDGMYIAFQNKVGSNTEICMIRRDGSGLVNVTQNAARDMSPAFSADGHQILFSSDRSFGSGQFDLFSMNADGTDQKQIYSDKAGISITPVFAPSGREVLFMSDKVGARTGNFEIFRINLDEPGLEQRLTIRPGADSHPAISDDGRRIAFSSTADGNAEIYVMNADGSSLLRLTRNLAHDEGPRWSPDGRRIIFSSNRGGRHALYEIEIGE